ncbi:MAG: lamin tail domain-containing protein, partial [Roseibacillus sp.]
FIAGLIVRVIEDGQEVTYAFGMENGDFLRARKIVGTTETRLGSVTWGEGAAVVRMRRVGSALHFDYRVSPGTWETLHSEDIDAEASLERGGIFASTTSALMARFEFDYFVVVDPASESAAVEDLRITEVMYHPLDLGVGYDLEFIELANTGSSSIDLSGIRFEDGNPFSGLVFDGLELAAGEIAVVTANPSDFRAIYGEGIRVLASWADGGISNGGESIVLVDAGGDIIHDFEYSDDLPWPVEADGEGASLEVIDTEGNYNDPSNWRASLVLGGTPGIVTSEGDLDNDGLDDAGEALAGTDPLNPDSDGDGALDGSEVDAGTDPLDLLSVFKLIEVTRVGDTTRASWNSVPGRSYTLQVSPDLTPDSWADVGTVEASRGITVLPHVSADGQELYYRVVVE